MGTNGIVHMDAGKYISRSISRIKAADHSGKDVLLRIKQRSEVSAVMVKRTDDQADCHAAEQINT